MTAAPFLRFALGLIPWRMRDRIKLLPGVAPLQRKVVSTLLDGRAFEHRVDAGPAKGVTFLVQMPQDKGIWTGSYESAFAERVAAAVRPGAAAFDIGSWHGFFAGVMAAQGAHPVHVFEPLPENAARIAKLIALNPDKTIVLHQCAVGSEDAHMELEVMPQTSMAKLVASTFQSEEKGSTRLRVAVRSIDSVLAAGEARPPALMKIDVEGAEAMVLSGARETLRWHRPVVFIEAHSSGLLRDCKALLEERHYTIELIDPDPQAARARDVFQIMAIPTH